MEAAEQNCNKHDSNSDEKTILINDITNNIIKREDYKNHEVKIKLNSIEEQGFLGSTCEVDIKGVKEDREQETNLFIKIMNSSNFTFIKVPEAYANELFVYRNLAKVFEDLQEAYNVPEAERYKMVKSYPESSSNVIVLENLHNKGYRTHHRSKIVSLDFAVSAVKELAKFHALSFAIKEKRPKYFERHLQNMNHPYVFNEDWSNFIDNFLAITMKYVSNDVRRKLEVFKMMFLEKYRMYLEDDTHKRCLCHGDYRPSNILKKEINGKVSEVIPIDYQLVYYGCPVMDLIYFIFASLDQKMRQNIPYIKDMYYESLKSFLTYFNIEVQDVLPRKEFEVMYKERLDYGLQTSLVMIPILMTPDDDLTELDAMTTISQDTNKECQERMIGIINDFIEWGYL
ncbi:uncharacterized protein LOC115452683 [Manduca sexta]|uniref:uncharacterized protein LOC115452683 n=1 Tax=Manduca sexta TaxID=7130 RepID=UPI00188E8DEE|nr:uncharacterized protein LOC115452683 [Manduca sexta]